MTLASRCTSLVAWTIEPLESRTLLDAAPTLAVEQVLAGDTQTGRSAGTQDVTAIAAGVDENGHPVSLAVWTDDRSALNEPPSVGSLYFGTRLGQLSDIYAARIDAAGNVIDTTPIVVNQNEFYQSRPEVGWNGADWLVTWTTEREGDHYYQDIHGARIAPDGTVKDPTPIVIQSAPGYGSFWPLAVANAGDEWAVIHHGINGGLYALRATRVAADGTVINPGGRFLANGLPFDVDLQHLPESAGGPPGGQYLLTYDDGLSALAQRYDVNFNPIGPLIALNPGVEGADARVAANGIEWGIVFDDYGSGFSFGPTWFRTVAADGTLGTRLVVNDDNLSQDKSDVVWDGGDWVVVSGMADVSDYGIYARRISPSGVVSSRLQLTGAGDQRRARAAAVVGGSVQVAFENRDYSAGTGHIAGVNFTATGMSPEAPVSLAPPRQSVPDLADNGNGFLAVWRDDRQSRSWVAAQRLNADGTSLDPEPIELGDMSRLQAPAVAFNGSVYLATWSFDGNIFGRRVGLDGLPIDAQPFFIMSGRDADVAALNDTFLVVGSLQPFPEHRFAAAARVHANGVVLDTPPIQLNHTLAFDEHPAVAAVGDRWLVAWENNLSHNNERSEIEASFVDAAGIPTPDIVVGSIQNGYFDAPDIAFDGTNALIVWEDSNADQANGNILARRIDPAGTLLGGTFVVSAAPRRQSMARVAFDGTNHIITWIDQRNYGFPNQDRDDVFAARVSTAGLVLDPDGFAVANSDLPETTPTIGVSSAGAVFAYSKLLNAEPHGTMRLVTRAAADTVAPLVADGRFAFQTGQWVELRFSEDVGASLALDDLSVLNLITNQPLPTQSMTYDPATWTASFAFHAPIADGNYRATLPAGSVTDPSGNPLAADYTIEFAFLQGDANRDGRVNLDDFNILAANFGQSPRDFAQGDFNYDGVVNLLDFNILAARIGAVLAASSAGSGSLFDQLSWRAADDEDRLI